MENTASIRVLEKNGLTCEGIIRDHYLISGEYRDSYNYAILEDEWRLLRANNAPRNAVTGINHITISVKKIEESLAFYRDILGCKLAAIWDSGAYLLVGQTWIALHQDENRAISENEDYSHIAFSVTREAFASIKERIERTGTTIWQNNRTEGESVYFMDPNMQKLEIHVGNLSTRIAEMKSDPWNGLQILHRKY